MSTEQTPIEDPKETQETQGREEVPIERTNAYRAGFMSGYVRDNPNADPSVAGYMDGYFVQNEGAKEDSE